MISTTQKVRKMKYIYKKWTHSQYFDSQNKPASLYKVR